MSTGATSSYPASLYCTSDRLVPLRAASYYSSNREARNARAARGATTRRLATLTYLLPISIARARLSMRDRVELPPRSVEECDTNCQQQHRLSRTERCRSCCLRAKITVASIDCGSIGKATTAVSHSSMSIADAVSRVPVCVCCCVRYVCTLECVCVSVYVRVAENVPYVARERTTNDRHWSRSAGATRDVERDSRGLYEGGRPTASDRARERRR